MMSPPLSGFSPRNMARMIFAESVPSIPEVSFLRIHWREDSAKWCSLWVVAISWVGMALSAQSSLDIPLRWRKSGLSKTSGFMGGLGRRMVPFSQIFSPIWMLFCGGMCATIFEPMIFSGPWRILMTASVWRSGLSGFSRGGVWMIP